ncbi:MULTISPECIES: alpha/beta fold hydrolase [unclassified Polaromonas]|jgi:pimeloyl-ACP methyl ester carboxylesterase|uniref:alpha/beta fold hydrolase n=1 Tax=unclassified Polaromonas TaxID=2638319 RepID=UPI000F07B42B|nr:MULTISPECIES: alpha/beta fold hydrolase [unclassified Polaromonas]AYQ26660.1 alpha/beta hydrolase [Polaromonas sp. SP1]QGJ18497.1 alpha/beta fold hydrolase [Polaromonas sp. Pch-P]
MSNVKWTGGVEHWTHKKTPEGDIKLFLWEKKASTKVPHAGTIFFVHGSSMASQPTFDLHVPGRAYSSAMDWFAEHGFDTWTMDNEGYGRSDKHRDINFDISNGADDLAAGSEYIMKKTGAQSLLLYGISSGALKAGLFAERHPERVGKIALDAFVWTGEGSHTLEQRKKKLPEFLAKNRRAIDRPFVHSIFQRDHPDTVEQRVVEAFADAILTLDDSMPTGTYVDMCSKLPLLDPKKLTVPTIILRGEYDGIAGMDDLIDYFKLLPNMNKQFSVMRGISHASFQQKNYMMVYQILHSFFTMPEPSYKG